MKYSLTEILALATAIIFCLMVSKDLSIILSIGGYHWMEIILYILFFIFAPVTLFGFIKNSISGAINLAKSLKNKN